MNYANDLTGFFFIMGLLFLILLVTVILERKRIPEARGEDTSHDFHVRQIPMPQGVSPTTAAPHAAI